MRNTLTLAPELRKVVANAIVSDTHRFNEIILGKSPLEYAKWIQLPASWGGVPELIVLSEYFKVELAVVDIVNVRHEVFGQDKGYQERVYLIYAGIHYDLCVKNLQDNGE